MLTGVLKLIFCDGTPWRRIVCELVVMNNVISVVLPGLVSRISMILIASVACVCRIQSMYMLIRVECRSLQNDKI